MKRSAEYISEFNHLKAKMLCLLSFLESNSQFFIMCPYTFHIRSISNPYTFHIDSISDPYTIHKQSIYVPYCSHRPGIDLAYPVHIPASAGRMKISLSVLLASCGMTNRARSPPVGDAFLLKRHLSLYQNNLKTLK
jgi:hypothetical protein